MCGRFTRLYTWAELHELWELATPRKPLELKPSWNVALTQDTPIVRMGEDGREAVMARWGLIPFFARGEPPKYSTINATVEKLETSPAWRGPWKRAQRCILPVSGFYEWHLTASGSS